MPAASNAMIRWRDDRAQAWQPEVMQSITEKLDFLYVASPNT